MASIFENLGYNFTPSANDVIEFSEEVVDSLDKIPPLLDEWQYEDLRNDDAATTNYVKNPTREISELIIQTVQNIFDEANSATNLTDIKDSCNNIIGTIEPEVQGSASKYIEHCDRLAGLVQPNEDTIDLPHYNGAMSTAKMVMYLVYQSDGIQNNAPMIGSFTSLFMKEELESAQITIKDYANTINASITCAYDPGPEEIVCTSNLTSGQITSIVAGLDAINDIFTVRRTHDENYYTNSVALLETYNELRNYKDVGATESNLFINYIGTDRLKSNIA
jgi:hypothetical protein